MDLELVSKNTPAGAGRIIANSNSVLTFDLVVRAVGNDEELPPTLAVSAVGGSARLLDESGVDGKPPETSDARLMRADKVAFYRFHARLPNTASWLRHEVTFKVSPKSGEQTHSIVVSQPLSLRLAMALLLSAVVFFGWRLIPVAMKLAPTNWNVVLGLVLKGAPAAFAGALVLTVLKGAFSQIKGGELSVLGMRRPETMFAAAAAIALLGAVLPMFCWEVHNRTEGKLKANWSMFESVDFASGAWVSGIGWDGIDEVGIKSIVPEYDARYCALECPVNAGLGACQASNGNCKTKRDWKSYEVFCRTQAWDYGGTLSEPLNAEPDPDAKESARLNLKLSKKDGCAPPAFAEATATEGENQLRLRWTEAQVPDLGRVRKYLEPPGSGDGDTPGKHALEINVGSNSEHPKRVKISAVADSNAPSWLLSTSTLVTANSHPFFVPVPADARSLSVTLRDTQDGSVSSTLECSRTQSVSWKIVVTFANKGYVRDYEQYSGSVYSHWKATHGAEFFAACVDTSIAQAPSSGQIRLTRTQVRNDEARPSVPFDRGQAPQQLSILVEDEAQGTVTCLLSSPSGSGAVRFETRPSKDPLSSEGVTVSSWAPTLAAAPPWLCTSGAAEKPATKASPTLSAAVSSANACCFAAGQYIRMSCNEPNWKCGPASFRDSMSTWLSNQGCEPRAARECFLVK